jgi:signal transduction histidine kinase
MQTDSQLPIKKERMELATLSRELVAEMRTFYPKKDIVLKVLGGTNGEWDKSRIGQVLSNLIGNAIAHGFSDMAVTVEVEGRAQEVVVSVHNHGQPIPEDKIDETFESLVRADDGNKAHAGSIHLGLGLYIAERIVGAHRGTIEVTSSEREGTAFVVNLPRHPAITSLSYTDVVDFDSWQGSQVRRKRFFFEKKNQKTFGSLVSAADMTGTY